MQQEKDEGLIGNEWLEECIGDLQEKPSVETLSIALTAVRKRMEAGGQFIVAVEASMGQQLQIQAMEIENGEKWLPVYSGFEEQMKGGQQVMSTFMADIRSILDMALAEPSLNGVLLNPWGKTLRLDKDLIRLVKGEAE